MRVIRLGGTRALPGRGGYPISFGVELVFKVWR